MESSQNTDLDGDGVTDTLESDLDGDGVTDLLVADTDFDGYAESVVSAYDDELAAADVAQLDAEAVDGTASGDTGTVETEATYYGDDGDAAFTTPDGSVSMSGTTVGGDSISFDPDLGATVTPAFDAGYDAGFDVDF